MYPNLYFAIKDLFGISLPVLRFINSFGFFVALSFIAAAVTLTKELMRKEREGLLHYREQLVLIGKPATPSELSLNFLLGFILGFKLVGLFTADSALTANVQEYLLSLQGSLPAGIVGGALLAGLKFYEKNKQKLPQPQEKKVRIWPHDRVGDLTIYAFIFGFAGAKIFNSLETWDDFVRDPMGSLFSFSGLTFYGGLICAALAIWYYARKNGIGFWHLNDAAAPGLMLAYSVGRIGCQVSGDGDWGILNSAYITSASGKPVLTDHVDLMKTLQQNSAMYVSQFGSLDKVPHLTVKAPSFLPDWLFAYSYPHNVIGEGVRIADCNGQYCSQLPIPVFPTPIYETLVCGILFFILWSLRKRLRVPGTLFGIYLILNGIERFLIEHIRVNSTYNIFGFHPTQAELISFGLVITGALIYFNLKRRGTPPAAATGTQVE
ncbi:MAG TPA: prolipoprotein diacylglyceryl transferase family protein [Puia sp.]|uniref:prolipoprotein diacylglyceryl transferase n=1 Tax=Puia sp. TaxID=2045100 RepID=UPI002BC5061B|nr:prolipoprotein diacylglyceryl transferase family protein [Puia sp.]HVU96457.1 prolipoprotein diacylglyceryl transferase family protein [Puia sp.]